VGFRYAICPPNLFSGGARRLEARTPLSYHRNPRAKNEISAVYQGILVPFLGRRSEMTEEHGSDTTTEDSLTDAMASLTDGSGLDTDLCSAEDPEDVDDEGEDDEDEE
jgi:hypothetical protein